MNFIHASPLLWLWYDEVMVCSMLSFLQNCLKLSDIKFVNSSATIFFQSPNSVDIILMTLIRLAVERPPFFSTTGNVL